MNNALIDNIKSIPPVTRFFTISTVLACLGVTSFEAFPKLYINLNAVLQDYALVRYVIQKGSTFTILRTISLVVIGWYRFVTSFLVPSGIMSPNRINALFDTYFFYTFSNHLEAYEGKFKGNFPDYLWFIILCGTCIQISNLFLDAVAGDYSPATYFPHENLLACLTYVWSRSLKNARINLLGLVPIKAYYLPLGNLIVKLILGGPVALIDTLVGILSGYLYLCVQSNTMPLYNLLSGAYGFRKKRNVEGQRVGLTHIDQRASSNLHDFIEDSIYDKGYLKAPKWLYSLLSYPYHTSVRTTAFTTAPGKVNPGIRRAVSPQQQAGPQHYQQQQQQQQQQHHHHQSQSHSHSQSTGSSTGYSWFGESDGAFKGKGHRLGG
ncbi:hypothetical protein PVL30_002349 [Lodderomyces elongisporus]|uniref:uncharacterized protein n=1 Tax=Lodderomyces elongisporus TaxID=36914 RepID=UPI0029208032|nr:uncharacterized protein PVL30_002349 [Lodderomyces elongisporus]WLF78609.1 hypothetical protein PVL30_002349 [Lodderomyces elongisporus]